MIGGIVKLGDREWESYWESQYKNSGVQLKDDAKALFQMSFEIDPEKRPEIKEIDEKVLWEVES
eukprot:TRINITY_DN562_c0_g1_i2.p3 TRINITY_DN562_c0_g1~~TRINITY_DN562_c0_g1_i2.p3  ORF type:complete len:64 (-),score=16.83 TRINITY_DN562_c0_g1_i2:345-536(-)